MQATTERDFGVKREDSGGFLLRRLRKCLGRVAERNRRNSGPDAERLDAKIKQTWPSILPWTDSWSQQEVVMQQAVDDLQQSSTASRLSQWRDRIKRGGREAHRWLRCETGSLPASLHDDGPSSKCPSESLAILSSYWRRVWDRSGGPSEDEIFENWREAMGPSREPLAWTPFTYDEIEATLRKSTSTASGPSGWTADELKAWPKQALMDFVDIANKMFVSTGFSLLVGKK